VPDPVIREYGDAIARVDATTICGTDLQILKGDVPETTSGRILGHEAVGTVVEVGSWVKTRQVGTGARRASRRVDAAASAGKATMGSASERPRSEALTRFESLGNISVKVFAVCPMTRHIDGKKHHSSPHF
jgi:NADPH:quinone reductase-like Zn-dependent oxidoreductase